MTDKILYVAFALLWPVLIVGAIIERESNPTRTHGPSDVYGSTTVIRKDSKQTKKEISELETRIKKLERKVR